MQCHVVVLDTTDNMRTPATQNAFKTRNTRKKIAATSSCENNNNNATRDDALGTVRRHAPLHVRLDNSVSYMVVSTYVMLLV